MMLVIIIPYWRKCEVIAIKDFFIHQKRLKELFVTVLENGVIYELQNSEKIIFGMKISPEDNSYVLRKELTMNDFDNDSGKYRLLLRTSETNVNSGRYYWDCAVDSHNELYHIDSGRIIVAAAVVK